MVQPALTTEQIKEVVSNCSFQGWKINVGNDGTRLYIQVEDPHGIDSVTGEPLPWKSRKWFVSPHMCVSELIRTVYKCVNGAMEHELDERFKYKNVCVFDPHRNIDLLVQIASDPNAIDSRDNRTMSPIMNEKPIEHPNAEAPWALVPVEGVKCPVTFMLCDHRDIKDKQRCNRNGCPYDVSGDDGMFY